VLQTLKEKKTAFTQYCKAASSQAKQAATAQKSDATSTFKKLVSDSISDYRKAYFEDFAKKFRKDVRFLAISDERDRKSLYKDVVESLKHKEVEARKAEKARLKDGFFELLKSVAEIRTDSDWKDVKYHIRFFSIFLSLS
jgi:hypothetical protein